MRLTIRVLGTRVATVLGCIAFSWGVHDYQDLTLLEFAKALDEAKRRRLS